MSMLKEKRKLLFSIFLISCIFISMSFVSANTNITHDGLQSIKYGDSILENNPKNNLLDDDNLNGSVDIPECTVTHHDELIYVVLCGSDNNSLNDNKSENGTEITVTHDDKPIIPTITGPINWTDIHPDVNLTNKTNTSKVVIKKSSVNVFAKNKVFNKKLKTKFYSVVLKCNAGNVLKNTGVTLKIKGKLFKAKTNKKGKATFKITKLNKKGKYNAKISFKGSKYYNSAVKYVKIIIK